MTDSEWTKELFRVHLPRWQELPDVSLYKDQVVSQLTKYLILFKDSEEDLITPSMINNYVKWKIIPAPDRRKLYGRSQLGALLTVTLLKPALEIRLIQDAMNYQSSLSGEEKAYDDFCTCFESCARFVSAELQNLPKAETVPPQVTPENEVLISASLAFLFQTAARRGIQTRSQLMKEGESR